jgi:hypothetical protein
MNRTTLHPIEVLLLAAMALAWAVLTLARLVLVPLAAMVLVMAGWRPASPQPPTTAPPPPAPAEHPLARLASGLEALPAATLRSLAGTRSKRYRKAELIAMVAACA